MKFTCEKYVLLSAVGISSRAVAARSTIPTLEGLYLSAGNGVRITGYDLKKGIYTTIAADVAEPGSVVLGARLLGEIVRSLPEGIVTVSCERGNLVKITCGDAEFSIMGIDSEDYPELPTVDSRDYVSLPGKLLKSMINQTLFAISDNESRPVYTGSMFEIENGVLTLVSVDGYRMALRREEIGGPGGEETERKSFIVPGTALSDVEKICSDDDEAVKITLGAKHISFTMGQTVLVTRRLEGEFINYKKAVPSEFYIGVTADKAALSRSIERVSLIIDDRTKNPLRCCFMDQSVKFYCTTALGKAEDICPITGDGRDLEIGFNNRYLLEALKAAPAERLKICLNTGSSPCVLAPEDGKDNFLYMILPVRLKAGD